MPKIKKVILMVLAFFMGVVITIIGIRYVFPVFELLGLILVPVWAATLVIGTYLLPEAVTVAYDPLGHPALHAIGILLNSIFIGGIILVIYTFLKRARHSRHESTKPT